MSTPLASVILPTHKQPGTLAYSVQSVQAQTEKNIELLVVCDGADEQTKYEARKLARDDSRIRVLDFPKSGGRGYENRHKAILLSKGEVIFYIDEDDLWFPDHVEKLLAILRVAAADVACSTMASVAANGEVQVALFDHTQGPLRDLLASRSWRAIFKIHLCHTKRSYLSLERGWSVAPDDDSVFSLLSSLAAPSYKWASIPQVTALSFHGSPRRSAGFSDERRTIEVARLAERIQSSALTGASVFERASITHYLFSLFWRVSPKANEGLDQYLESIGSHFRSHSVPINTEEGRHEKVRLSAEQTSDAQTLIKWWNKRSISPRKAFRLAVALSQTVNGPPIFTLYAATKFVLSAILGPSNFLRIRLTIQKFVRHKTIVE